MKTIFIPRSNTSLVMATATILAMAITLASGRTADQAQTAKPMPAQASSPEMTDEELEKVGDPLVTKVCAMACHGFQELEEMRRNRSDWSNQISTMINKGAQASPAEAVVIRKYLTRFYGFVAINTAPADEISEALGISAKDAATIVAYREANGKFADMDALKKVAGIDLTKIEEQPDAIRFK